jgi:hypothetical protein
LVVDRSEATPLELLFKLAFVGVLAWVVWRAVQPRSTFAVRIVDGAPMKVKGAVTCAFLEQIREVCTAHAVRRGKICGIIRGGRISLSFSRGIPASAQQQLRNLWAISNS